MGGLITLDGVDYLRKTGSRNSVKPTYVIIEPLPDIAGLADSLTEAVERAVADFERAKEGKPPEARILPPDTPAMDSRGKGVL